MSSPGQGPRFATWAPEVVRRPVDVRAREATEADVPDAAELAQRTVGGEGWCERFANDLRRLDRSLAVARVEGVFTGYGRAWYFDRGRDVPGNAAPAGWYLGGLVVEPTWRRRGIGEAITVARLAWLGKRTREVWYFVNQANLASIELHARLGFVEVSRDFSFPGVTFREGGGLLCRVRL